MCACYLEDPLHISLILRPGPRDRDASYVWCPQNYDEPRIETGVDCVGAKVSVEFLMDRTADVVALFGVQREDYAYAPRHSGLRLCGYKGHWRESAEYAVGLIAAGKLRLAPLVTHCLPLERYDEGVDLLEAREAIKICFMPWSGR